MAYFFTILSMDRGVSRPPVPSLSRKFINNDFSDELRTDKYFFIHSKARCEKYTARGVPPFPITESSKSFLSFMLANCSVLSETSSAIRRPVENNDSSMARSLILMASLGWTVFKSFSTCSMVRNFMLFVLLSALGRVILSGGNETISFCTK